MSKPCANPRASFQINDLALGVSGFLNPGYKARRRKTTTLFPVYPNPLNPKTNFMSL